MRHPRQSESEVKGVRHQARCGRRRLIAEQGSDINDNAYTSTDFAGLAFIKVEEALG